MSPRYLVVALASLSLAAACGDDVDPVATSPTATATATAGSGATGGATSTSTTTPSGGGTTSTGAGAGGGEPPGSDGCGIDPGETTGAWLPKTVTVASAEREYFVRLPPGYSPDRAYPVVYQFHGCSNQPAKENNHPPLEDQVGSDAILVRGRAVGNCWDVAPDGPDVAFFDALVVTTEAAYCADAERRFATGYSSGAFMTHRLSCERGDVLRGVASIAGGLAGNGCTGQVGALLIHDVDDGTVDIGQSEAARDRYLEDNGCDAGAPTSPGDHSPCEVYAGCDAAYPVVWCQTTGMNHARQDALAAPAFWDFLSSL